MAKIVLSWSNDSNIHSHQKIYKSLSVFDPNTLPSNEVTIGRDVRAYEDTDVVEGLTYYYAVATVDWDGVEYLSDVIPVLAEPSGGDPYWSNVLLLSYFDQSWNDEKGGVWSGNSSGFVPSINSYAASFPGSYGTYRDKGISQGLGAGDFTIEGKMMISGSQPTSYSGLLAIGQRGHESGGIYLRTNQGRLQLTMAGSNSVVFSVPFPTNVEFSFCIQRVDGTVQFFIDGDLVASKLNATNLTRTVVRVGYSSQDPGGFLGYMDELRITRSIARYSGNYVPSPDPFPNFGV